MSTEAKVITTPEELDGLPTEAHIWGSSYRHGQVPGSGSPYLKLPNGEWWDYANDYSVGVDDIMLPAVLIFAPEREVTP